MLRGISRSKNLCECKASISPQIQWQSAEYVKVMKYFDEYIQSFKSKVREALLKNPENLFSNKNGDILIFQKKPVQN